jgi:hypothetical protein
MRDRRNPNKSILNLKASKTRENPNSLRKGLNERMQNMENMEGRRTEV